METTEQENEALLEWVDSAESNKKHFTDMCSIWNISNKKASDSFNAQTAFGVFKHKINSIDKPLEISRNKDIKKSKFVYSLLAVAASVAVLVSVYVFNPYFKSQQTEVTCSNLELSKQIVLPDSSIVTLQANSSLKYPESFDGNTRSVFLEGSAFFQVAKNGSLFEVYTENTKTTVLGTSFFINTNGIGSCTDIFVRSGKVLFAGQNNSVVLELGEKASFSTINKDISTKTIESDNYLSWKTGRLVFKEQELSSVFKDLENHYNVTFSVSTPEIMQCRLTAKYDNKPLDSVLKSLEVLYGLYFEKSNKIILVSGKACR